MIAPFVLSFRMKAKGGGVSEGVMAEYYVRRVLQASRVVFITHGYNVPQEPGVRSLDAFAHRLRGAMPGAAIVPVLWPGDNFLRGLAYPVKGKTADDTARAFARWIFDRELHQKDLNFISHSLGARVVLETVKLLYPARVNEVCLMAAAVDDSSLLRERQYQPVLERIQRVSVLSSKKDRVLRYAYPAGDLTHFFQNLRNPPDMALGYHGPRPSKPDKVHHFQIDDLAPNPGADHGHYLPGKMTDGIPVLAKREAAMRFASDAVTGAPAPCYRL